MAAPPDLVHSLQPTVAWPRTRCTLFPGRNGAQSVQAGLAALGDARQRPLLLEQQEVERKRDGGQTAPHPAEAVGEAVVMVTRVGGRANDADGGVYVTDYISDYFV